MKLEKANEIANKVLEQLRPHCLRSEIAGSIRRRCREVKDIEIVVIPKPYGTGLFETGIATVINKWRAVKGDLPCKYTQRMLPEGIKLDLFFATPQNWGNILLIRTGDWEFSKLFMGVLLPMHGYRHEGGYLKNESGEAIECLSEVTLFRLCSIEYIEARHRNREAIMPFIGRM